MGEVLIAGTASLLICVFLSPKFIAFLRAREFGQSIREEGPEGHHAKAGTPTMGGIIIFTAIAVPFLLLTDFDFDWRAIGVFGVAVACALLGFADDYTKLVKRRSLGLRGRTKLVVTMAISIGLWLVATRGREPAGHAGPARGRRDDRPRLPVSAVHLPGGRGHDVGREPDRRAGRPGRGLRGDRPAGLHRDHVHRPASSGCRWSPAAWSARASASCGSTRSRPRSSWGTRARWAWAARSRRWP